VETVVCEQKDKVDPVSTSVEYPLADKEGDGLFEIFWMIFVVLTTASGSRVVDLNNIGRSVSGRYRIVLVIATTGWDVPKNGLRLGKDEGGATRSLRISRKSCSS